jgi:hypothetical protein
MQQPDLSSELVLAFSAPYIPTAGQQPPPWLLATFAIPLKLLDFFWK